MCNSKVLLRNIAVIISALTWLSSVSVGVLENSEGAWIAKTRNALFVNNSKVLMEKWILDITLPRWSLAIWEFIYTWNTIWVMYCISTMCRPGDAKIGIASYSIVVFPTSFYTMWSLAGLSHISWIFFFDREVVIASVFFQAFAVLFSFLCLYISHSVVHRSGAFLQMCKPWDLWVSRTLVQNGIAMYATWTAIVFLVNLASILTYEGKIPSYFTSVGALGIIGFCLLLWFCLETFVLDNWMRYTFTVYPTVGWAAAAMLLRHFQPWSHVTILCLAILCASLFALIFRVPLVVWRNFSYPLYINQTLPHEVATQIDSVTCKGNKQIISTII